MDEQEIARLVQSMLVSVQAETVEVVTVDGDTATVYRQGQTVETRAFPSAIGLNLAAGERVVLLRPGGDLNAGIIMAKLTGTGLAAATATNATSAASATNADKVDNIHFRNNAGTLEWSPNGTDWYAT